MIQQGNFKVKGDLRVLFIGGKDFNEFEIELFDAYDTGAYVEKDMVRFIKRFDKANPWTPAALGHLIAFGAQYPNIVKNLGLVVALEGSISGRTSSLSNDEPGIGNDKIVLAASEGRITMGAAYGSYLAVRIKK